MSRTDPFVFNPFNVGAVISYVGSGFSGFAFQKGQRTIAGELMRSMEVCLSESPSLIVAGRTDRGVHARGQVISFRVSGLREFDPDRFVKSMNSLLDPGISVRTAWIADADFSARFSARYRTYRYSYRYGNTPDPFVDPFSWRVIDRLDLDLVSTASQCLVGEHDFSSFCRKDPNGASLKRRVDWIRLEEKTEGVDLWISASSFCHQMVRSIAGLLYQVGCRKISPTYVSDALEGCDRKWVKLLAPPSGLVLWEVGYDAGVIPEWS
jgi:tRNA pseudouridine38-40 synthase